MRGKQSRERGSTLKPIQRSFIEEKFRQENLSIRAGAVKYNIAETSLRNALKGKSQDYSTLEDIIDRLSVPADRVLMDRHPLRFNIPRERNGYFTGREDKLKALCEPLKKKNFAALTQELTGLGGMGKTATAIEYAYRCLDKAEFPHYPRYKAIQFVRADTAETLKYGYAEIARALGLPGAATMNVKEAVQAVITWMARAEEAPWLLVLDNADELDMTEFFPQGLHRHYGHVLITSRSPHSADRSQRIDIAEMTTEEGVVFLYRRTQREGERISASPEEKAAQSLVEAMGGLPLALEQAAAYITDGKVISFEDYLTDFRDKRFRAKLLEHIPEYGFYHRFQPGTREYAETLTVLSVWNISLEKIEPHHPDAVRLLRLCAFLYPVDIPRELVFALLPDYFASAAGDAQQKIRLYNDLLNVLVNHALIQRDLNKATHSMHLLVQTVLRDAIKPEDQKRDCERILAAITESFPTEDYVLGGRGALYYPHAESIRQHLEIYKIESENSALLLSQMGCFLRPQGRFTEAEPLLEQALSLRRKILSEGHTDVATSRDHLGLLYYDQGRFAEAELFMEQALSIRQKALPETHTDIATSQLNLGLLYWKRGRLEAAEQKYRLVLSLQNQALPPDHSDITTTLHNIGTLYTDMYRWGEAEDYLKQALRRRRHILPADDPDIATTINSLATLYINQSRLEEAESCLKEALKIWQKSLLDNHPNIAVSLNNLAVLYWKQNRFAEAERVFLEALSLRQKTLRADHPDCVDNLNNLGLVYQKQERWAEAETLLKQALNIKQETLPAEHDSIAQSLYNLGMHYRKQGRPIEARPLIEQACAMREKAFPKGHPGRTAFRKGLDELYQSFPHLEKEKE